ncbi:MAG: RsmE family RNA methyltransferase, partial [Fibrobacter sp.]|nr:RsmE family RNA methyltransferase [Fibrobacter sp.]
MNLILLFQNDFIDSSTNRVRLLDRRKEHILNVYRSKKGDRLRLGIWNGMLGFGTVTDVNHNYVELEIELTEPPPAPLPLTLILALPRPKSLKKCLEIATCMGIKRIFIIESWRVEKSYWTNPVLKEENLNSHIILGLEQAKDTVPPKVEVRKFFKRFVEDEISAIIEGTTALVGHPYAKAR